jgi:iron(III) transport system permease protein
LISIEIIKELPITLILRPFNFETFSTKAFNMASSDLIEGAAIPSLFIILWSSLLIILSIKFFLRDQK